MLPLSERISAIERESDVNALAMGFELPIALWGRGLLGLKVENGREPLHATSFRSNTNDIAVYSPHCAPAQQPEKAKLHAGSLREDAACPVTPLRSTRTQLMRR